MPPHAAERKRGKNARDGGWKFSLLLPVVRVLYYYLLIHARTRERLNNRDNRNVILNDGMAPHNRPIVPSASPERARNPFIVCVCMRKQSAKFGDKNLSISVTLCYI